MLGCLLGFLLLKLQKIVVAAIINGFEHLLALEESLRYRVVRIGSPLQFGQHLTVAESDVWRILTNR